MKKLLLPLCLLSVLTGSAQIKTTKGLILTSNSSVAYALPRTTLKICLEVEKESIRKGPYARYAQKYLGVMAPLADKDIYSIKNATISFAEEADPVQVYTMENPEKSPVKIYNPTREGLMAAPLDGDRKTPSAFIPNENCVAPVCQAPQSISYLGSDTSFVKVNIDRRSTIEQNPETAAMDAANMIYMLRKKRTELVCGDAGENVFGAGLQAALNELNRLEQEYLSLFLGKQFKTTLVRQYDVVPESDKNSAIVCRFSTQGGLLPSSDLTGRPILVELTPEQKAQHTVLGRKGKDPRGTVYYRIADVVDCRLTDGKQELAQRRVPIYQFGAVVEVPVNALK